MQAIPPDSLRLSAIKFAGAANRCNNAAHIRAITGGAVPALEDAQFVRDLDAYLVALVELRRELTAWEALLIPTVT